MEQKHLRALIAIVEEGSFRGGAKRLGISQPSLSQQIGRLEDHVGSMLFERHPDGVSLTRSGHLLYERAQSILGLIDETRELIRSEAEAQRAVVNVAAIPTIAPYVLPRAIETLKKHRSDVVINAAEITTDELLDSVSRGAIDVGVIASVPENDQGVYSVEQLGDEPLQIAMASGSKWAERPFLCAEDLQEAGVIVLGEMHCLGGQVSEFCATQSVDRIVQIESGQIMTLVELVRRDIGVTLLPATMLAGHDTSGIEIRTVKDGAPSRPICMVQHRHRPQSAVAKQMAQCIKGVYE